MKFKIIANTSFHDFEIGEEVFPAEHIHPEEQGYAWANFCQVFMQNASGEAWWISINEMEITK